MRVLTILLIAAAIHAEPRDRITRRIDPARSHTLRGTVHHLTQAQFDRGRARPGTAMHDILIVFQPSPEQQEELDLLLVEHQNPSSPQYHRWLTPEGFGARFGLSDADRGKVRAWLQSEGLHVDETARGGNYLKFSGSVAQVSRALRTEFHRFRADGRDHLANVTEVAIPETLAGIVAGFIGLDDFGSEPAYNTSGGAHYLAPEDFGTIYNIAPLYQAGIDGTGQSIAVVGQSRFQLSDIQNFRTMFHLPANDPKVILYGTADPGLVTSGNVQIEADLDVEWAGAVAPKATLYYVYGPDARAAAVFIINNNLAPVISMSFADCEANGNGPVYRGFFQQANAQGITVVAASGDSGAASCDGHGLAPQASRGYAVEFPASLPEVTGVGGTQFEIADSYFNSSNSPNLGSALSYIPESAWNTSSVRGLGSSGGGPSIFYPKPLWQIAPGVPKDGARDVPDVSFNASSSVAGYLTVASGVLHASGGTSASTPAMAGVVALLNQYQKQNGLGNINPRLYQIAQAAPSVFHDVTGGDNIVPCSQGSPDCTTGSIGYQAGPGYDLATGIGSIDATALFQQWNAPLSNVVVTLQPSAVAASIVDMITVKATLTAVKGQGVPTGTIEFSAAGVNLGSATLRVDGTATITFPAYLVGAGGASVVGEYSGDSVFTSGGASFELQVSAPRGVSGVLLTAPPEVGMSGTNNGVSYWQPRLTFNEISGVPTAITAFSIDDQPQDVSQFFTNTAIPANVSLSMMVTIPNVTQSAHTLTVSGKDASGFTWSRQVSMLFLGPAPGSRFNLRAVSVNQDPNADPGCRWRVPLLFEESGGQAAVITDIPLDGVSRPDQVVPILGTSRIDAWGSILAPMCFGPGINPGDQHTIGVTTSAGFAGTSTLTFYGPATNPVHMSATPSVVMVTESKGATITVALADPTVQWFASVYPLNRTGAWLSISPASGTGSGQITIQASGEGFEPGVYRATIAILSPSATPEIASIAVMFVFGGDKAGMEIQGMVNSFSYRPAASPGMLMSIFGSQLADSVVDVSAAPVLTAGGLSVTVNGVAAPILYVSPGLINVQVPYSVGAGPAVVGVNNHGRIAGFPFQIDASAPGIFAAATVSAPAGGTAAVLITGAGDVSPSFASAFAAPPSTTLSSPPQPILPVSVTVGGVAAKVQSEVLVGTGVVQVSFVAPASMSGTQPVVVTVGSASSAPVNLTIQ